MKKRKKAIERYDKLFKSYLEDKEFIKIEREFDGEDSHISGFLLNFSKDFIFMLCATRESWMKSINI